MTAINFPPVPSFKAYKDLVLQYKFRCEELEAYAEDLKAFGQKSLNESIAGLEAEIEKERARADDLYRKLVARRRLEIRGTVGLNERDAGLMAEVGREEVSISRLVLDMRATLGDDGAEALGKALLRATTDLPANPAQIAIVDPPDSRQPLPRVPAPTGFRRPGTRYILTREDVSGDAPVAECATLSDIWWALKGWWPESKGWEATLNTTSLYFWRDGSVLASLREVFETRAFDLSELQLGQALLNVGVDLQCGACAELFFCGSRSVTHTCGPTTTEAPTAPADPGGLTDSEKVVLQVCSTNGGRFFIGDGDASAEAMALVSKGVLVRDPSGDLTSRRGRDALYTLTDLGRKMATLAGDGCCTPGPNSRCIRCGGYIE